MPVFAKFQGPLGQLAYSDFVCTPPTMRTGNYTFPCGVKSAAAQQAVAALYAAVSGLVAAWNNSGRSRISLTLPPQSTVTSTTAGLIAQLLQLFTNGNDPAQDWIDQLRTGAADWITRMDQITALLQQLAASIRPYQAPVQTTFVTPTAAPKVTSTASKGGFVFTPPHEATPPAAQTCPEGFTYDAATGACAFTTVATPPPASSGGSGGEGGGSGTPVVPGPMVLSPLANMLMSMTPEQFAQQWKTLAAQAGVPDSQQAQILDMLQSIVLGQSSLYPPGQLGMLAQALQQIPRPQALADLDAVRATISTFPWVTAGLVAGGLLAAGGVAWWLWGREAAQ